MTKKTEKIEGQRLGPRAAQVDTSETPYDGLSSRAMAQYRKMGFDLTPKPEHDSPKLPRDVAALPFAENTNLHAEFVRWIEFAEQQAALWGTKVAEGEAKLEHMFRTIKMSFDGSATEKVDFSKTDPRYIEIDVKLKEDQAVLALVRAKCVAFEKARGLLSRDVHRQVQEFDMSRRERGLERVGQPRRAQPARAKTEDLPFREDDDV